MNISNILILHNRSGFWNRYLLTCFFCLIGFFLQGQSYYISGPTSVTQGQTYTYNIGNVSNYSNVSWYSPSGGVVVSLSGKSANVRWDYSGLSPLWVYFYTNGNYYYLSLDVNVIGTAPANPPNPTVVGAGPGVVGLQRVGSPPSGVTWYWQSVANGTSFAEGSGATKNVTSGTVYYIRAYKNGTWSTGSGYVNFVIPPPPPPDPPNPVIEGASPGIVGLKFTGSPPEGVTWYWQTSPTGMSMNEGSESAITVTTGSVYYLRAYQDGLWSTGVGVVNYTIPPSNPTPPLLSDENYLYSRQYNQPRLISEPTGSPVLVESVTYFDGLGKPKQQVIINGGSNSEDLVTHIDYDKFGRTDKDRLPVPIATGDEGTYRTQDLKALADNFYSNKYSQDFDTIINPFSQKEFEDSPLNRILKQASPGQDWRLGGGHEIEFDYKANSSSEVRLFTVNLTSDFIPTLIGGLSYFGAGELFKNVTRDENHISGTKNTTEEFTDKQGRIVLKRSYGDSDINEDGVITSTEQNVKHDTYYVYNDYGNLSFVISPKVDLSNGVSQDELDNLCYQYVYDNRNRLVKKRIPGKGWEYIVYNKLDQPTMIQDAMLATQYKWIFTKYDIFGRVVYTGLWVGNSNNSDQDDLQLVFDGALAQHETRQSLPKSGLSDQLYYDNVAKPIGINQIYTINYYDSYLPSGAQGKVILPIKTTYNDTLTINVKTLPTVSRVRVLTTNDWITTTTGYDKKGRAIWIRTVNDYLDTDDIVELKLDFTGKVLESRTVHNKAGQSTITTIDKFTYDHMGRLTKQTQKINSQAEELIALNSYNELGQLENKKVGGVYNGNGLQSIDYGYNVRGWLKTINNPGVASPDKLFAFKINYNTQDHGATPLYNGNISETEWRTTNTDNSLKWYKYGYDVLNRITYAKDNLDRYSLSSTTNPVTYDKSGNITSLLRKGHKVANPVSSYSSHFGTMDNLAYVYDAGNKLLKVTDAISLSGSVKGQFHDGNTSGNDYEYDANGNMIKDLNKGIVGTNNTAGIQYNHLNLPTSVTISDNKGDGTGAITYIYDATGIKLQRSASGDITQYAGNYIYKNGSLEFFNQPEGYVEKPGTLYEYVYQYKDHLGNIRLSYKNIGSVSSPNLQIEDEKNYYPFGLEHKGYNNIVNGVENNYKTYQGQERTEDLGLNVLEFKWRIHDPAIARFWQIDPLAEKFAYNSTYAFSENSPIGFFELEGLEKISIHSASFAPFKTFGGPYKGDGANRKFGTNPSASSRIYGRVDLDASSSGITQIGDATARGSESHNTLTGNKTYSEAEIEANLSESNPTNQNNIASAELDFHVSGNNDLVPGSPDIDAKGNIGIAHKDLGENGSIIGISGNIFGDKFPANETFLTDASGTGIFLGVSGADGNPFTSLAGNNNRKMSSFTLAISFNKSGNITGVIYNGKNYSVEDWNKQFQNLNPQSDDTSTNKN